jgi:2,3-bisphosphoglycerate-dependent phosphoglycerate mutase
VAPYYLRAILPVVLRGAATLVVAHGNTLRALVMALEGLTPSEVEDLEIRTGELRKYEMAYDATIKRI